MRRFIYKKINDKIPSRKRFNVVKESDIKPIIEEKESIVLPIEENKEEIKEEVMDTKEKIQMAAAVLGNEQPKIKKVKKDKGLIERTESSITILTEDNRELLKD